MESFHHPSDYETLLRHANMALHQAKGTGRNYFVVCSSALKADALSVLHLTNSLYHALDRGELFLHYQPQIHVDTGRLDGLEALVRWTHPKHGSIPPGELILIAEQTGVIHALGTGCCARHASMPRNGAETGTRPSAWR